jgi:hypothetical protein
VPLFALRDKRSLPAAAIQPCELRRCTNASLQRIATAHLHVIVTQPASTTYLRAASAAEAGLLSRLGARSARAPLAGRVPRLRRGQPGAQVLELGFVAGKFPAAQSSWSSLSRHMSERGLPLPSSSGTASSIGRSDEKGLSWCAL